MHLHETVGPAKTTVSGIADEAGVQRATVYRHFPDDEALIAACSAHWMTPQRAARSRRVGGDRRPGRAARGGALRRLRLVRAHRDDGRQAAARRPSRARALRARCRDRDAYFDAVAETLLAGRGLRGRRRQRVRAAIAHGLAFDTWRSLVRARRPGARRGGRPRRRDGLRGGGLGARGSAPVAAGRGHLDPEAARRRRTGRSPSTRRATSSRW